MGRFPVSPLDVFLPALPACEVLFHSLSLEQQQYLIRKNKTHACQPLHWRSFTKEVGLLGWNMGDVFKQQALGASFFKPVSRKKRCAQKAQALQSWMAQRVARVSIVFIYSKRLLLLPCFDGIFEFFWIAIKTWSIYVHSSVGFQHRIGQDSQMCITPSRAPILANKQKKTFQTSPCVSIILHSLRV